MRVPQDQHEPGDGRFWAKLWTMGTTCLAAQGPMTIYKGGHWLAAQEAASQPHSLYTVISLWGLVAHFEWVDMF